MTTLYYAVDHTADGRIDPLDSFRASPEVRVRIPALSKTLVAMAPTPVVTISLLSMVVTIYNPGETTLVGGQQWAQSLLFARIG